MFPVRRPGQEAKSAPYIMLGARYNPDAVYRLSVDLASGQHRGTLAMAAPITVVSQRLTNFNLFRLSTSLSSRWGSEAQRGSG